MHKQRTKILTWVTRAAEGIPNAVSLISLLWRDATRVHPEACRVLPEQLECSGSPVHQCRLPVQHGSTKWLLCWSSCACWLDAHWEYSLGVMQAQRRRRSCCTGTWPISVSSSPSCPICAGCPRAEGRKSSADSMALLTSLQQPLSKSGHLPHTKMLALPPAEFANAQLVRRLSMKSWDQDDPHEMLGQHAFLPGTAQLPSAGPERL